MTVFARTANASANVRRRSRIGWGSGTIDPEGRPTKIVRPVPAARFVCEKVATRPRADARAQVRRLPGGPAEQATEVIDAGTPTVTVARSIRTGHWFPIASP